MLAFSDNPDVILDGVNVGGDFISIPGSGYAYYETELTVGEHEIIAEEGVSAYAYGFIPYDAYTYHLGFESLPTPVDFANDDFTPLKIFPNPIGDWLKIENHSLKDAKSVELYDIYGRKVIDQQEILAGQYLDLDVGHLTEAMYFLNYQMDEKSYIKKLIKK